MKKKVWLATPCSLEIFLMLPLIQFQCRLLCVFHFTLVLAVFSQSKLIVDRIPSLYFCVSVSVCVSRFVMQGETWRSLGFKTGFGFVFDQCSSC